MKKELNSTPIKYKCQTLFNRVKSFLARPDVRSAVTHFLLLSSFTFPVILLYLLEPTSFQYSWKGRTFYIFFLWLFSVEFVLAWNKLSNRELKPFKVWVSVTSVNMLLPTLYVVLTSVLGLKSGIVEFGQFVGVPFGGEYGMWLLEYSWPLSLEYLLFTCFFITSVWLMYGVNGLKRLSASWFFLGAVGSFYMLDTFYPYGAFKVLQGFVPFTASAAAFILSSVGYSAWVVSIRDFSLLWVTRAGGRKVAFKIYWPCAGIHSLFIYTFTIALFLRGAHMSVRRKVGYIIVGAVGTFFVNILRIVAICILGITFHEYLGEIFFIIWMLTYLSIIFLIESYMKRKNREMAPTKPGVPSSNIETLKAYCFS